MKNFTKPLLVSIIGCGDIAGGYDERKKNDGIFSHAGAYRQFPNIEIDSAFDVNNNRLDAFCRYWNVKRQCRSLGELLNGNYDIVSVCTPDSTHKAILNEILDSGCAKYIWAEKPLALTAVDGQGLIEKAQDKKVGLWLSVQRRWEPCHQAIRERIANKEFGDLIHAALYYVKGIVHNGCTAIDTLRFFFGEINLAVAFPPYSVGSYGADNSLRGLLSFADGGTANVIGCDIDKYVYSIFELDIICTKGRIKIEENGDIIRVYKEFEYDHYPGFKELQQVDKIDTGMKWSIKNGLELLVEDLAQKQYSTVSAKEAINDLKVVDALRLSAQEGGTRIEL